ncbi:hypothetical protein MKX08_003728 [Trichoderma sp. CBMAI-0020]|nr:hypothetical protein MKX08_003728 [Trichoderma sp. CBMAI-0020]
MEEVTRRSMKLGSMHGWPVSGMGRDLTRWNRQYSTNSRIVASGLIATRTSHERERGETLASDWPEFDAFAWDLVCNVIVVDDIRGDGSCWHLRTAM